MNFIRRTWETFTAWRQRRREIRRERRGLIRLRVTPSEEFIEVDINDPSMIIRGREIENTTDDPDLPKFIAFLGIPYAHPPVRDLRFQPPQPFLLFDRIPSQKEYDFDNYICRQEVITASGKAEYVGSEDCLYLHVYVPKKPNLITTRLPVLVYIHGGGFSHGSGNISNVRPDRILKQNLVFVTINYRLHAFGFLNLGTETCRGNAGLKDQVQALKWIQRNIGKFGGDPTNVTISGHSAGASCVNFHMISPLSKGLFHKAIVHAGGLYCPWGFRGDYTKMRNIYIGNIRNDDLVEAMVRVFKDDESRDCILTVTDYIATLKLRKEPNRIFVLLGPTVEKIKKNAFLPNDIEKLKRNAEPVPLIAGICQGEGYTHVLNMGDQLPFKKWINEDEKFETFLTQTFRWSEKSARRHRQSMKTMYFPYPDYVSEMQLEKGFANLFTDVCFRRFYDNFEIGKHQKSFYVYQFCYITFQSAKRETNKGQEILLQMPAHGDEFCYLYNPDLFRDSEGTISVENKRVMDMLCSMLADFCKIGGFENNIVVDEVHWWQHSEKDPCYLRIDKKLEMRHGFMNELRWPKLDQIVRLAQQIESPTVLDRPLHELLGWPNKLKVPSKIQNR